MLHNVSPSSRTQKSPWLIWLWAAGFYFLMSFFRGIPNAISGQLKEAFALTEESFALLSTSFYWPYCLMQIPVGLSIDRWGTKKSLQVGSFIFTIGIILFGWAKGFATVFLGRLLMGLGGSFAFAGIIKICSLWFSPLRVAFMIGLSTGVGKIGGASVNMLPWSWLETKAWSWRLTVDVTAVLSFLTFLGLSFFLTPDPSPPEKESPQEENGSIRSALKSTIRNPHLWVLGGFTCFLYVILSVFGDVFSKDFVLNIYPYLGQDQARFYTSFLLIGNFVGSPTIAFLADKFQRRRWFMQGSALTLWCLFSFWIIFCQSIPLYGAGAILFLLGFITAAQSLSFAAVGDLVPSSMEGVALGFVNTLAMSGGALLPIFMGTFMDAMEKGPWSTLQAYQISLGLLSLSLAFAFCLSFFIPKTKVRTKRS